MLSVQGRARRPAHGLSITSERSWECRRGSSAERNALNAVIKVLTPSLYAALFGFGVRRGVIGLPFFTTAFLLFLSAATAWSIPDHLWRQSDPQEAGTTKAAAEARPAAAKSE